MSEYMPDKWEVVKIPLDNNEHINKVFGTWYGASDHWRLSSGIVEVVEHDLFYEVNNQSGSVYVCYKNRRGTNGYTSNVLKSFNNEVINIQELIK